MAEDPPCEPIELAALKHRSTMGKHVSWGLFLAGILAGAELYFMRTIVLATALLPIISALAQGYAERKRNGRPPQG